MAKKRATFVIVLERLIVLLVKKGIITRDEAFSLEEER
jgi:hypothetical protein